MASSNSNISYVDFSGLGLQIEDVSQADPNQVQNIVEELRTAFTTVGFVYLKNYGIPPEEITMALDVSRRFFTLPESVKRKVKRPDDGNSGYVCIGLESFNKDRPSDLREAYNITPCERSAMIMPDDDLPEFRETIMALYDNCKKLSMRVLYALAMALKLEDLTFFEKNHQYIGCGPNQTTLRTLYYPPIKNAEEVMPNQVRCGEHSDYGTITLLWQDDCGGLEVMNRHGNYVAAEPMKDAVLVNIADLLQFWTSDELISAKHRVMIPAAELRQRRIRQSLAFFVHPDDDTLVTPLNGSIKHEPITALQHLLNRFSETY
ncbi:PREDICTED: UPF0676 protein C1494.01-like [Priapulus caudatus]|uniref:UPF0676 protein C1494.01-like n=1 Tax=Priapulus caudatus TaxID=37621 RepID=A0ABM1E675_PRICU|nr:PREDICTED: UPF0676 protein C1494.01-like [Priapulus caudatus]